MYFLTNAIEVFSEELPANKRANYDSAIYRIVAGQIYPTQMGRILVQAIDRARAHLLRIAPYFPKNANDLNAFAAPDSADANLRTLANGTLQAGRGANSTIRFAPDLFAAFVSRQQGHLHDAGAMPHEVLYHEMVHSLRQMLGLAEQIRLGANFDNTEEFYAILLANIYISERNNSLAPANQEDLRADHHSSESIFEQLRNGSEMLNRNSRDLSGDFLRIPGNATVINRLIAEQPTFCSQVAGVNCGFNPIRRVFLTQRQAQAQPRNQAGSAAQRPGQFVGAGR
jgi:hypothetical protein